MNRFGSFFLQGGGFWPSLGAQMLLILFTFLFAVLIGLPLGVLCMRHRSLKPPLLGAVRLLQTLPAFAVFGLLVAFGRAGLIRSVILALFYTVLPVIIGTEEGLSAVGRPPVDAALGMGLSRQQIVLRIVLPLASPQIMNGLRRAAVTAVGMTTLATLQGGGLGGMIMAGITQGDPQRILAGALPACLLALGADRLMALLQRFVVPEPLRRSEKEPLYVSK